MEKKLNLIDKTILFSNRGFWIFQSLFWFINWIIHFLFAHQQPGYNLVYNILTYVFPILSSIYLRHIYSKYYIYKKSVISILLIFFSSSIVCGIIYYIGRQICNLIFLGNLNFLNYDYLLANFFPTLWLSSVIFLIWNFIFLGFKISEELFQQKLNAEKALALAQSSQLEMLRYQLNPHFLFNTLSSLRALIKKKDNDIAEIMVTRISEFLKYSLLDGENSKVPLTKEIKIIRHYFEIEKVRFNDNLVINYNIDPESENIQIPVFLIHPLVENAVKYGMKTSRVPLQIELKTSVQKNKLLIEIMNSGEWYNKSRLNNSTGTGLKNTVERLKLAYPEKHNFEIIKNPDSVHIKINIEY